MIILAACFLFLLPGDASQKKQYKLIKVSFWALQVSLFVFWLSLNLAGTYKGNWQMQENQVPYSVMMTNLKPYFTVFIFGGSFLLIFLGIISGYLLLHLRKNQ